jgi:hypothetical protein
MYNKGILISEEERQTILNWVCANYYSTQKLRGKRAYEMIPGDAFIPKLFWDIRDRITEKEGLHACKPEEKIHDLLTLVLPGGELTGHLDDNEGDLVHMRFNLYILTPPYSCETFYAGHPVETPERTYAVCRSGIDIHWITKNETDIPRIAISYGYLMSKEMAELKYPAATPTDSSTALNEYETKLYKFREDMGFYVGDTGYWYTHEDD